MTTATIVVCTRNRVEILPRCLASLDNQVAAPGGLEILVVDNGSADGTAALLRDWQRGGQHRRVVVEPRPGLSRARNAALEASTRDVVLFLDDDALAPPTWATAHVAVYDDNPMTGMAGGPIGLVWPNGRPAWITDELTQWLSALELGDDVEPFPTVHGPYGTNMSVRRTAALAVGGFDPRLGRHGEKLTSGEEPDLTRRLVAAGWEILYVAAAAVVHQVLDDRIDRRWFLRRGWAQGVSNARLEVLAGERPRGACLRRAGTELRESAAHFTRGRANTDGERLSAFARMLAHAGAAAEFLRSSLRTTTPASE